MDKYADANQEDMNQEDIASNETKAVIKSLSTKKSLGPNGLVADFYKTFKEVLIPILQEIEREGTLPNSF
jgi:hypothetical protein